MRAPAFWWREPGLAATLLRPFAAIYGAVAARRLGAAGASAGVPVICVGNFTVGGSGKTPTALALAELLRARGSRPGFLLRGYGGRLPGPVLVDVDRHGSEAVGDEALLLARREMTAVSGDRLAGARLLRSSGVDAIVMDDGLQNPALHKDLSVAVFDGAVGLGNGSVLPAGPLRASAETQWPLVDAAVIIGPGASGADIAEEAERHGKPVLFAHAAPDPAAAARLRGTRVFAFAGIGRPEKFFDTLRALGAEVAVGRAFGDHQMIGRDTLAALASEARSSGLRLVTTEKDAVRLGPAGQEHGIEILPIRLAFDDPADVEALLDRLPKRPGPAA